MIGRLLVGALVGLLVGAAAASALFFGLHMTLAAGWLAYASAAGIGVLTGLFAGKPIWAKGGAIEAGLKGVFGLGLALLAMFAVRRWGNVAMFGVLSVAEHPMLVLPAIATLLGSFFGLDNTPESSAEADKKTRVAMKAPVVSEADMEDEDENPAARRLKK